MNDPATSTAVIGAALTFIARTIYELVRQSKNGPHMECKFQCRADSTTLALQGALNLQTSTLLRLEESNKEIRDASQRLVIIQQERGR